MSKNKSATARKSSKSNSNAATVEQPAAPTVEQPAAPTVAPTAKAQPATLDTGARIKALVVECPKRPGTTCYTRAVRYWQVYVKGGTVQAALDAGATKADLRWDLKHGFISIGA